MDVLRDVLRDVVQNCQFFLMYSAFLIALTMAEVPVPNAPIPTVLVALTYGPILHIFSLSVKLHFLLIPYME